MTTKAMLINVSEENIKKIDNLMTVFCSAIRYSFNRILENKRIGDIQKDIAHKYGLNMTKQRCSRKCKADKNKSKKALKNEL